MANTANITGNEYGERLMTHQQRTDTTVQRSEFHRIQHERDTGVRNPGPTNAVEREISIERSDHE